MKSSKNYLEASQMSKTKKTAKGEEVLVLKSGKTTRDKKVARKEGDVVVEPIGIPYFFRKRPPLRKGARIMMKKRKRLGYELKPAEGEEDVFFVPQDDIEIEGWEKEMKDYEGEGSRGDEEGGFGEDDDSGGEDDGFGEEEGGSDGEDDDEDSDGEEEEEEEIDGADYEIQEDLVRAKVPISAAKREGAAKVGITIPEYETKLVPQKVRRRIYETELRYPGYQYMKVGSDGQLLPLVNITPRPVKIIGDLPPKPKLSYSPEKVKIQQNPYDNRYPFGTYVSFSDIPIGRLEGIVIAFTRDGVEVSVNGRIHFINYDNPTLKVMPKPKRRGMPPPRKEMTVEDVYLLSEIPAEFRDMVVKAYIDVLKLIKEPSKPSKKIAMVDWLMLQNPLISWEDYYAREFQKWVMLTYRARFTDEINTNEIEEEARKLVEYQSSVDGLLDQITGVLDNGLWYDTDINQLLAALRKQSSLTVFQAQTIQTLEKEILAGGGGRQEFVSSYKPARLPKGGIEPTEKYYRQPGKDPILRTTPPQTTVPRLVETKPISGKSLAIVLENVIESYLRTHQSTLEDAIAMLTHVAVNAKTGEYDPSEADKARFEAENLETLIDLYREASEKYKTEKENANKAFALSNEHEALLLEYDGEIERTVKTFERIVYAANGGSVHAYLSSVLVPYIFLDSPISPHAKFFRAKLANGDFDFAALTGANLAHYLPEFAMNKDLTEAQWNNVADVLGNVLKNQIDALIDLYMAISNPTARREYSPLRLQSFGLTDNIIRFLKDPSNICFKDTESGKRPVVKDGKYVYAPGTTDLLMEKIPPGEMTICYSDGKFTCHEIREILRAISQDGEPLNPYTGKPYPAEFVAKMKNRYADRLEEASLWEEPGDPDVVPPRSPSPGLRTKKPAPDREPKKPEEEPEEEPKAERKRHKPPKKAKGRIEKIGIVGDWAEILTLFGTTSFDIWASKKKGVVPDTPRTFNFTDDLQDEDINILVFGFDASKPGTIANLDATLFGEDILVYAIGYNAKGIKPLDKAKLTRRVQKAIPGVQHTFYLDSDSEAEIIAGLSDVAIDVEALQVFGK